MDYEAFREQWIASHPASVPQPPEGAISTYPDWMRKAIVAMFIASALISGAHTAPTIYAGIEQGVLPDWARFGVALSGFVAVELAIFVASYARMKDAGNRTATMLLIIVIAIAVLSNLYSVGKALGVDGDLGLTVVSIGLGVGMPLVALLSGDRIAHLYSDNQKAVADAWREHREALQRMDTRINAAWEKEQAKQLPAPIHTPVQRMNSLNEVNEQGSREYSANSANGYSKRMDARAVTHEWFERHPEMLGEKLDRLVAVIEADTGVKVGRTSIHNVRKDIQAVRMNGGSH